MLGIAVPLVTGGRVLGTLSLVGAPETLDLDKTDLPVLTGVAAQLAVALDREHLADLHRVRAEHERRRLQAEVQDLRSALQQDQIVFQSSAMNDLLSRARRVAATDTTVLITGESGTGKERLAQTVHQLSARRAKPFVIVDCGAIPATLIDSELFGHERGAFTGAQQRSLGRLAQADGGTVFLDEIGELPLDVQSRLLRFVQEKTISMVGGTRAAHRRRAHHRRNQPPARGRGDGPAASATICSTASTWSVCISHRCVSAPRTCGSWPSTSRVPSPPSSASW